MSKDLQESDRTFTSMNGDKVFLSNLGMERLEKIAEVMHKAWSHWMKHLFSKCKEEQKDNNTCWHGSELVQEPYTGRVTLTFEAQDIWRWKNQIERSYESLSNEEQNSDLQWAWEVMRTLEAINLASLFQYEVRTSFYSERYPIFFSLIRESDETGVSGTGEVLKGVILPDGRTIIEWISDIKSTTIYKSFSDFLQIHVIRHPNNNHRLHILKGTQWEKVIISQKEIEKGVWKLHI